MKNIEQILKDLYLLDPELKEHEAEIKKIVTKLLESQPDIKLDQKFALALKKELKTKVKSMKKTQTNFLQNISYVLAGALVCAILIISVNYYNNQNQNNIQLAFQSRIDKLEDRAFGPLVGQNLSSEASLSENSPAGLGAGSASTESSSMMTKSMIMPEEMVNYSFTYQGENLVLDSSQMKVLKRNKENKSTLPDILKNMNLGLVNLAGVQNGKLQNINVVEDREFGYMINVNFQEGTISIYENWEKWPQNREGNLNLSDVPEDNELINIANKFIQEKGINLDNYGEAYINDSWKEYAYRSLNPEETAEGEVYVPDSIPVIYPLILDDKEVFDQGGNPSGISVNVNIRYNKVAGAWNIKTQDYQSSSYETETNIDRIVEIAQSGGINYHQYYQATRTINLELEDPELIYIIYYQYIHNQSEEMIIPALRFKVKDNDEAPYKLNNILVPLVKEILDDLENQENQPILFRQ